jgi:SAM-dependent methyltransferase
MVEKGAAMASESVAYSLPGLLERSALRRFSHGARFNATLKLLDPQPGEMILDYGTGDGKLLTLIHGCKLFGYEPDSRTLPFLNKALRGIATPSDDLAKLPKGFDKITCLEVLEHVSPQETVHILENCRELLRPNGKLIVSVPLEIGPSSIGKNVVRRMKGDTPEVNATFGNIVKAGLFDSIERLDYGGGYYGHMGFDYRTLERFFAAEKWTIEKRTFSPFPPLGPILNSQVLYRLRAD